MGPRYLLAAMLSLLVLSAKGGYLKPGADKLHDEQIDFADGEEQEMLNDVDETGHHFEKYGHVDDSSEEHDGEEGEVLEDTDVDNSEFDLDDVGKHNGQETKIFYNDIDGSGLDNSEFSVDDVGHGGNGGDEYGPDEEEDDEEKEEE
nr:unnamed protein product [Spirometra erinaceieuropaei]